MSNARVAMVTMKENQMTAKKDCTKTICPLCERKCQAGSTSSGFIENNGACLHCVFGKTQEQINELIAAKGKNSKLKNKIKKGVFMGLDLGTKEARGLIAIKNNCIQNVDVAELNSDEIDNSCACAACLALWYGLAVIADNSCACAACQHRRNSDDMKIKSPAIFEGYEVSKTFIRNENAYIGDGGYAEEVTIKKTWQKPDGSAWVTFLSNMRMGFLDMQLADFAKKYKAKPTPAPKPKADAPAPASDDKRYFYVTFSCNGGGKKGFKRGYICVRTFGNKIFSIERLSKNIKEILLIKGQRVKDVLITDWKEVNKIDYKQLTDDENETPCKLL